MKKYEWSWNLDLPMNEEKALEECQSVTVTSSTFVENILARSKKVKKEANFDLQLIMCKKYSAWRIYLD